MSPFGDEQQVAALSATEVPLFCVAGPDGRLSAVNESFARLLGLTLAEVSGRPLLELIDPADLARISVGVRALMAGADEVLLESGFAQRDGHWVRLKWVARQVDGKQMWSASSRDADEYHRLLAQRVDLHAQLDLALGAETAAMWEFDVRRQHLGWEPQAAELLGVSVAALPESPQALAAVVIPDDVAAVRTALQNLVSLGTAHAELHVGPADDARQLSLRGKVLDRDRRGRPTRAVGLLIDVTREKAMEEQMLRMVMSDALTGVPNRRAFDQALRSELRRAGRALQALSVLMIDIDDFKRFNDIFGHLVGDEALCTLARAFDTSIHREGDLLARFGGEEFALVLPNTDRAGAKTIADRLVRSARSINLRQAPGKSVSVSIGSATWLPDTAMVRPAELLARADEAMYAAKAAGKDRSVAYEDSLAARADLEAAIAGGLAAGQFELYYQPTVTLATGQVSGFEALARWNRPGHGLVSPDLFIPVAEAATSTLINDLGRWALRDAACQLAAWLSDGVSGGARLRVAVNASGRHISSPAIVADVEAALAESGLDPDQLELELTETVLTDDALVGAHLSRVRALGITVAIDDFGTGHTSIGQLPQLPVDTLKIDQSFVANSDPRHRALVKVIIEAAHAFNLAVVAEGVEDTETLQALVELKCDTVQGFLIARPMPAERIPMWLDLWRSAAR